MRIDNRLSHEIIADDVQAELTATFEKWGDQSHVIDASGPDVRVLGRSFKSWATIMKGINDAKYERDAQTGAIVPNAPKWSIILLEEVFEALEADDPKHLREELVQVSAVAQNWIKYIDARKP